MVAPPPDRRRWPAPTNRAGDADEASGAIKYSVSSHQLPISIMPCCQGFQKHGDRLPTVHISHGDDAGNINSDNNLENMPDFADFLPLEDDSVDTLTSDDGIGIIERVGPLEYIRRLQLKRSMLSIASAELGVNTKLSMIPESSRDLRHTGDLCWHEYYHMSEVSQSYAPGLFYQAEGISPRCRQSSRGIWFCCNPGW